MNCLGGKANKYGNVTLDDCLATGCSNLERVGSRIIYSCIEEWPGWQDSCRWQLSHKLLSSLSLEFVTGQALVDDCFRQVSDPWDPTFLP